MKELSLTIGSIASLISIPIWFVLGLQTLFSRDPGIGFLMIFIGVPVALAHAVVFDFVGEAIKSKRTDADGDKPKNQTCVSSDLRGTPWERDSGHTRK